MGKISGYSLDSEVTLSDKLIGTDAESSNATKNFSLSSIANLFLEDTLVPYTGATKDVDLGDFNISAEDVIVGNRISANGSYGTSGYVLVSQGSGSPAIWKNANEAVTSYYGSFYDTTDQTVTSGGIAALKYNTTVSNNGVSIVNDLSSDPTRITFSTAGVYNIQFSAQIQRLSGGSAKKISIWLRVNGVDVPNSATHLSVQANADYLLAAWNFFQSVTAGQYVEIMWSQDDAINIVAEPADVVIPHPAIPSVILTVNKIA